MKKDVSKKIRKRLDAVSEDMASRSRKRNLYRASSTTNTEIDFMLNFLANANGSAYPSRNLNSISDDKPLNEILEDVRFEEETPPELMEVYLAPNTKVLRNARMVSRVDEKQAEIMTAMYNMGIDVFGSYGKNMSKTAVKMVRSAVGDGGPLTKKERKKEKKRLKQEKKRMANKRNNDALLEKTLLKNRYTFTDEGNAISMRMSDLIR